MTDEDVKEIKEGLAKIREHQFAQAKCLGRLELCVIGDEELGVKGVVGLQIEHEAYIQKEKVNRNRLIGAFTAITFVWGLIVIFIKKLIE